MGGALWAMKETKRGVVEDFDDALGAITVGSS